jgi:CRISPR/Cas system endoribonuclease Cas6 (RAMP superfamily)
MAVLVLEEPRLGRRRAIIASSCDPEVIRAFWTSLLAEAEAAVQQFEENGEEVLAAVERAELQRLRRIACLFGGCLPDGEEAAP